MEELITQLLASVRGIWQGKTHAFLGDDSYGYYD